MAEKKGHLSDDVASAPESGTDRNETTGNLPSDRGCNPGQCCGKEAQQQEKDDPSVASEER